MPYKMANGKYRAHKMINGKRRTKVFSRVAEAKKWEANQDEEEWSQETTPIVSLGEWATSYLDMARERFSAGTYQEKRTCFKLFFQSVANDLEANALTLNQVARHLGHQARNRSGHAANKDRKNLKAAWTWGVKYLGLNERNPFNVERFPEQRQPRYVPPAEDMDTILHNETGEIHTFLLTMLHTAARRGELLRLRWDDLDFQRQTIRLSTRKRKGGTLEYDTIPMTETLREVLLEHRRNAKSVYVFCDDQGQPFSQRRWLMYRVCKRAGVTRFGFHAIRHLSASMMDRANVPVATIQAILRHKSRTTTDRYLHQLRGVRADLDVVFPGSKQNKVLNMKKASEG